MLIYVAQQAVQKTATPSGQQPSYVRREEHDELKTLLHEFMKDRLAMKATLEELEARVDFLEDRLEYVEAITRNNGTPLRVSQSLKCLI